MKKLIALIGAVATAFGLYAAGPADYYGNSFESFDEGVQSEVWSLQTLWSTTLTDEFKVGAYEGGELTGIYKTGAQRRDGSDEQTSKFINGADNAKYLKLETGTNVLDRALTDLATTGDKFYFDQLVKFTGFEEEPTFAADTKIAVWMSAIEQEGTPQIGTPQIGTPAQGVVGEEGYVPASDDYQPASEDYQPASDDYIAGETNLYVQVGTGAESISVQIDPASVGETEFAVDKWYRITIKSIGNIIGASGQDIESQLGFLVFINGKQASIVGKPLYHTVADALRADAAKYYAAGQLFTAIDTTTVALAKIGYQGIGAIDDVVLSASSPDFDMFVDINIDSLALNGAKVIKIGDVTITDQTSIKVKPGDILVSYEANGPYIVRNGDGVKWAVAADGTLVMDKAATIEVIEAAAKITRGGVDTYYAADELDAAIAQVQDGDTVTFLKDCTLLEGAYSFTAGTTIDVAAGGVMNIVSTGEIKNALGAMPEKQITAQIPEDSLLKLSGNVYGGASVATKLEANRARIEKDGLTVGAAFNEGSAAAGAILKVETLSFTKGKITLVGAGKVVTKSVVADGKIVGADSAEIASTTDGEGWTTYTVKQSTQAFEPSATVAADLATAIAYLKNNYYNKYTNGQKIDAPDASFVKVGTLASEVTGTVSIGGTVADAGEKFSLSIGNNAFLESAKFKIVDGNVYVAAVILAIEQVKVTANAKDYPIDSASSGQLALESFAAVAPTTIAGEGTNFTIVRGDDKPLVKFFFTDKVTQYFVTKKTFIGKDKVATTSYGFTTPDEGGLWLYLGYGVGLGGNWDGVTYNYTVYAFGVDKKAITLSMSITDKQPAFKPSATVAADLATAIAYLKNNYYNKYTNGQKIDAPDASYVKVGTLASGVSGMVSIGGEVAKADEKFSLSIGNNAFLESVKFKIVDGDVYVAAVILAIEQVKVTANAKDYLIDSANSGNLELKSFAAVAPTTIAGEGTNFTVVRGDDKPLVKFFFTDTVTQYFVTKKTFIDKNDVATTSYGFTTPDEGGLWLYLGYGVGLGGKWDGVTYNYTVYAFGVDKKAITLSMSITDKAVPPAGPTSDQGAIGEMNPSTGIAEFNPTDASVTEATVNLGDSKAKIAFPKQVKTIKGVPANQIVIKSEGYDITDALAFTGDSSTGITYDLNPDAIVATVPVKPTIAAENADITGGTLEVKGIAGLYYTLVGKDDVTQMATASKIADTQATETGATISLKDQRAEKPTVQFYQIKVTIDRIAE